MKVGEMVDRMCDMVDLDKESRVLDTYDSEGLPEGLSTGWSGFDDYLRIMKGQLNIVSGVPGSGKSEWLESLAVNMALNHKWRVFLYSPENFPTAYHMMKLIEKISGKPFKKRGDVEPMSRIERLEAEEFLKQNFEFVNPGTEPYDLDRLFFTIENKTVMERKIDMVIIDPWNELEQFRQKGKSETDYIGEKLMWCRRFARKHDISFWIVVHPAKLERKKDGSYPEPSMYDLSGSQHWYNKSDNGIILHRTDEDKKSNLILKAMVKKVKNRFCGKPGDHFFEFQPTCGRYVDFYPHANPVAIF